MRDYYKVVRRRDWIVIRPDDRSVCGSARVLAQSPRPPLPPPDETLVVLFYTSNSSIKPHRTLVESGVVHVLAGHERL